MKDVREETQTFKVVPEDAVSISAVLHEVYEALKEKGYNPVNQLVGYILSGDPTYITNHKNARNLIRKLERDEILEELVRSYIERH
ncbi:MAG: IreB family regulatory phosphoprotein [Firmicutes bacterium]|nr:IreB family regulatory phosphoprotein [Bacillota bacterium]